MSTHKDNKQIISDMARQIFEKLTSEANSDKSEPQNRDNKPNDAFDEPKTSDKVGFEKSEILNGADKIESLNGEDEVQKKKQSKKYQGFSEKRAEKASKKNSPVLNDLLKKKKEQILEERKALLKILGKLFGVQLFFMNIIVLFIILWSIFDWPGFRLIDVDILEKILEFSKYYVTAVLAELLGGIIFIVYSVFSDKD